MFEGRGCVYGVFKMLGDMSWGWEGRPAKGSRQIHKRVRYRAWDWEPRMTRLSAQLGVWKKEGRCEQWRGLLACMFLYLFRGRGDKCGVRDGKMMVWYG